MPTCIYCQRADPPCEFNREHVIPEALGMFEGDVQTLTQEVCRDCNQHFGDTLDLFLNRDSAEAMFRFRHGLKDPAEVRKMFKHRVRVRLPRDGSTYGGAHLDFSPPPEGNTEPFLDLVSQYGCQRKDGNGWEYFTEQQLRDDPALPGRITSECGPNRVILYDSPEAKDRLLQLVADLGLPMKQQQETQGFPPFEPGRVDALLEITFDGALARAVAKIGFNYFAKTQGADLALRPDFDPVRRFVRYGEGKPPDFVNFGPAPPPCSATQRGTLCPPGATWSQSGGMQPGGTSWPG